MNSLKKPIIINLSEYLNKSTAKSESRFVLSSNSFVKKVPEFQHSSDKLPNLYMTSEMDAEMKNDFKWLINFNVKEILRYAIDDELDENKSFKEEISVCKEKCDKHHSIKLIDIIQECLTKKGGVTIRYIYRWISGKFPCFKPRGRRWKDFVLEELLKNSIFKKKRSKRGKSDLWYVDESRLKGSNSINNNLEQDNTPQVSKGNLLKSRKTWKPRSTRKLAATFNPFKEYNTVDSIYFKTETDDTSIRDVQLHSPAIWVEQTEFHGKNLNETDEEPLQYYEMQVPLQTEFLVENTEAIEVLHYLDENTPIPLDLI